MQKKIKNKVDKQTKSKVLKIIFSLFSRQNKIKNIISAFLIVCPTLTKKIFFLNQIWVATSLFAKIFSLSSKNFFK